MQAERKHVVIPAKAGIHECRGIALGHTEAYQQASRQHRGWLDPSIRLDDGRGHLTMSIERQPAVYILASRRQGTLYFGVTSDLIKRAWQHRNETLGGFTARYGVHRLVFFELHSTMEAAITREKQIKWWRRAWKVRLIESTNPEWNDLWLVLLGMEQEQTP